MFAKLCGIDTRWLELKLNGDALKKIFLLIFWLIYTLGLPLLRDAHAGLPESPRGDSKSNSMEAGRQRPYGGASKTGQQAHLQSEKYKEERARLDKAYILKKKNIQQSTKSDLSRLSKQVKTKK